jgi:phosphopantothenoylcysteine decarboxylase
LVFPATMEEQHNHRKNVLIGVTGSVATVKLPLIVEALSSHFNVTVITTNCAQHFFKESQLNGVKLYRDADEWNTWSSMGDPVLHIELRRWADLFVVAPLDANTLAKLSHGQCDNLVTCVARAWDFTKPFLVAPSMNTAMYDHPCTGPQLQTLQSWGIDVIPVVSKRLACGDVGQGAMAEWETIVKLVRRRLESKEGG